MMDTRRINRIRALLESRRATLLHTRDGNVRGESDLLSEREADFLDTSAERSAARVLGRLADSELSEVIRIDAALRRIAAGRWGICETCGERIGETRLDAMPEASRCVECASADEVRP